MILLTDMFGGTPSNLAISAMEEMRVEVIAGLNLPMLIKLASIRGEAELATAIDEAQDGIGRISKIVKAMKKFAHPSTEMAQVDINGAIESTVTVASNEWKYVADMRMSLCPDMPTVRCNAGQINQSQVVTVGSRYLDIDDIASHLFVCVSNNVLLCL